MGKRGSTWEDIGGTSEDILPPLVTGTKVKLLKDGRRSSSIKGETKSCPSTLGPHNVLDVKPSEEVDCLALCDNPGESHHEHVDIEIQLLASLQMSSSCIRS